MSTIDPQDSRRTRIGTAVAVAPNGARRTKADHPNLPLQPAELARTAQECLQAGASLIHLHVRNRDGLHLLDVDAYRTAIKAIRDHCRERLVIQVTTEAVGRYRPEQQRALVRELRPEAVSLALRELAADHHAEAEFASLLEFMRKERIAPQIILYSKEDADKLAHMEARGLVPFERIPVLFVLGRYAANKAAHPTELASILQSARDRDWMLCAFGRQETQCAVAAALAGGDVRVGFENNTHMPDGTPAPNNAALVDAVVASLNHLGVRVVTADELRRSWAM